MTIINCTPHDLNIVREDGSILTIAPSGIIPRCTQMAEVICSLDGIAVTRQVFGEVYDLPAPKPDTYLVVSRLVASAAKGRKDLLVPGPMVRGDDGRPCGCKGLSVID